MDAIAAAEAIPVDGHLGTNSVGPGIARALCRALIAASSAILRLRLAHARGRLPPRASAGRGGGGGRSHDLTIGFGLSEAEALRQ